MKKIVIAIDSFKGSLTSEEAGKAAAEGIHLVFPDCQTIVFPIADGGEGTVDALCNRQGKRVTLSVRNPLGELVEASYWITPDGQTAVIEMAAASGLLLIPYRKGNVLETSTFGTGQMITDAIRRNCRTIWMGIGGSATNDGGTGMLQALGFRLLDEQGREIAGKGKNLSKIRRVDNSQAIPELKNCRFQVATDVDNPFYGQEGAACVFAPQKGATPGMVADLDEGMRHWATLIQRETGIDLQQVAGSGAAGGLGGACHAFLGAKLVPGIDLVLDHLHFKEAIRGADLIITGEGKIDRQTRRGKVVSGVLRCAREASIPVIAVAGNTAEMDEKLYEEGLAACFAILSEPVSLEQALDKTCARRNLRKTVEQIMRFAGTLKKLKRFGS